MMNGWIPVCLLGVGLRSAFVVDEEKGEEHEVGDREGDSCYHVDRLRHSYRMRRFLFSQLKSNDRKAGGGKMRKKISDQSHIESRSPPIYHLLHLDLDFQLKLFQSRKKKKIANSKSEFDSEEDRAILIRPTSAVHPLVVVCVQGLGPQLVQVTISFGPVVAPVGGPPSRFFLPCDRVSVEETYILTYIFSMLNNDPSFDQSLLYSTPLSVLFSFLFLFLSIFALPLFKVLVSKWRRKKKRKKKRRGLTPTPP